MRPLTDEETKVLFTKLYEYIGEALEYMINGAQEKSVFRLIRDRVFYVNGIIANMATNLPKD